MFPTRSLCSGVYSEERRITKGALIQHEAFKLQRAQQKGIGSALSNTNGLKSEPKPVTPSEQVVGADSASRVIEHVLQTSVQQKAHTKDDGTESVSRVTEHVLQSSVALESKPPDANDSVINFQRQDVKEVRSTQRWTMAVKLKIGETPISAVIDTAADATLIGRSLAERLDLKAHQKEPFFMTGAFKGHRAEGQLIRGIKLGIGDAVGTGRQVEGTGSYRKPQKEYFDHQWGDNSGRGKAII